LHNTTCSHLESNDRLSFQDHPLKRLNDFHNNDNFHEIHTYVIIRNSNHSACLINQRKHSLSSHDDSNQMNDYSFSFTCFHESLSFGIEDYFATSISDSSHNETTYYLLIALDAHVFISRSSSSNNMTGMKSLIHHSFPYRTSIKSILHDHDFHLKFHDKVAEWLERSYSERFPDNGKVSNVVFSNADQIGKAYMFFFIYHYKSFQSGLLIYNVYYLPGLNILRWLHWSYHIE